MDNNPDSNQAPKATQASKRSKIILAIIILVIAIALFWVLAARHNKKTVTPTQSSSTTSDIHTAQVTISSDGLEPATLNVPVNTQVTWKNDDTAAHQVASDPYPKDDAITGFNNNVVLQKGETYSFMFTAAGTYTYHDELNPLKINGTIIVK